MSLMENHEVIQAIPVNRSDQPFKQCVLPWILRRRDHFVHPQQLETTTKLVARRWNRGRVGDSAWRRVPQRLRSPAGRPIRGGMFGDAEMEYSSAPQSIMLARSHTIEQEHRIVVGSNPAVHEDKSLRIIVRIPIQDFRRKVNGSPQCWLARVATAVCGGCSLCGSGCCIQLRGYCLIGQGESVVMFCVTTRSRHLRCCGSSVVSAPNT